MRGFVIYHCDNRIMQIENAAALGICMNGDKYWEGIRENKDVRFVGVGSIFR